MSPLRRLVSLEMAHYNILYILFDPQASPEASKQTLFRLIPSLKRDGASLYLATSLFPKMEDMLVTVREMDPRREIGCSSWCS